MDRPRLFKLSPFTKKYTLPILIFWTAFILVLFFWRFQLERTEALDRARIEARSIWDHNLSYRKWVTFMGGVYARADRMAPNPYLKLPDRDKTTTDGIKLTMANPAYMTSQVFEIIRKETSLPIINRIVSDNYLNPANKADAWELKALRLFEGGIKEVSEVADLNGRSYMRLFKPMFVIEECLKCHGHQGYRIGDIRGGISVSIPLAPYFELMRATRKNLTLIFLLLWAGGVVVISVFTASVQKEQSRINEAEWKLRRLSEASNDFEYWISENRKEVLFIAPSCERITGYSREEFCQKPSLTIDIIAPEDRPLFETHLEHFVQSEHEALEFRIITKNGESRWMSHNCLPIYFEDRFLGRRVINRDITELKKAEVSVKESEERYRTLVDNIDLGITLIDRNHRIIMINKTQAGLFHRLVDDFAGKYCFQEFENREEICPHCPGIAAVAGGLTTEVITEGSRDDGSRFTVRIRAFPLTGSEKLAGSFIEVVEDITEQKKMQDELERHRKHLEEEVLARTAELAAKNAELERINRLFVNRELRMVELKERIAELEKLKGEQML